MREEFAAGLSSGELCQGLWSLVDLVHLAICMKYLYINRDVTE